MQPEVISRSNAEHYVWGQHADGWHLVRDPKLSVIEGKCSRGIPRCCTTTESPNSSSTCCQARGCWRLRAVTSAWPRARVYKLFQVLFTGSETNQRTKSDF